MYKELFTVIEFDDGYVTEVPLDFHMNGDRNWVAISLKNKLEIFQAEDYLIIPTYMEQEPTEQQVYELLDACAKFQTDNKELSGLNATAGDFRVNTDVLVITKKHGKYGIAVLEVTQIVKERNEN